MTELSFEPAAFRKALGSFATGVTIVTTFADGERVGVTANSFNSVSLDPPLVLWSLAKSSGSLAAFTKGSDFAVHILASDQHELSNRFANKGADKFRGLDVDVGRGGVPLLPGCAARFDCRTSYQYEGGDHIIFVGEVVGFSHSDEEPLLFHAGRYATRTRHETSDERSRLEQDFRSDDLTYLIASSYFQLLDPIRRSAAERGLSLSDHHALNVLLARGECHLGDVNDVIGHLGLTIDDASVRSMASRGLVTVRQDPGGDLITLTKAGHSLMIELIAAAKGREADAQLTVADSDVRLLKQLLRRFLKALEAHDDVSRVSRHMDLMRAIAADEAMRPPSDSPPPPSSPNTAQV